MKKRMISVLLILALALSLLPVVALADETIRDVYTTADLAAALNDQSVTTIRLNAPTKPGDTLELTSHYTISRNLTLDMQGRSLPGHGSFTIPKGYKLTIQNGGVIEGRIDVDNYGVLEGEGASFAGNVTCHTDAEIHSGEFSSIKAEINDGEACRRLPADASA